MPKSSTALSLPTNSQQPSDDHASRMSDVALRKKKNADAQAAFRARRANYIATLEETVTSLESVVLQLQDSCREARHETQELRQENTTLHHELREREKYWRSSWQAKKASQGVDTGNSFHLPPPFGSPHPSVMAMPSSQYGDGASSYRVSSDTPICDAPVYGANAGPYHGHPSSLAFTTMDTDISGEPSSNTLHAHRGLKYGSFSYPMPPMSRGVAWSASLAPNTASGEPGGAAHPSHSPSCVESPTLTSVGLSFIGRSFPPEEQKVPLSSLDAAPYAFPNSRSISPTTPSSASSTSLAPFHFTFPDNGGHGRSDHEYRRHSHPHTAEVTLHGGTADISLVGPASDTVRYRLTPRKETSDRPLLPALHPMSGSDNGSNQDQGSSDGDVTSYTQSRSRPRRGVTCSRSRSPSPPPPILSGTLAVIKAQAFGALRRTRARTRKSLEGAAKVAMDVLEARGIGIVSPPTSTLSHKRQRVDDEIKMPQT